MRVKFKVIEVKVYSGSHQEIKMGPVTEDPSNPTEKNENNALARDFPSGEFRVVTTDPSLMGAINKGEEYYIELTKAADSDEPPAPAENAQAHQPETPQETAGERVARSEERETKGDKARSLSHAKDEKDTKDTKKDSHHTSHHKTHHKGK